MPYMYVRDCQNGTSELEVGPERIGRAREEQHRWPHHLEVAGFEGAVTLLKIQVKGLLGSVEKLLARTTL
jgi:hypothetical protein